MSRLVLSTFAVVSAVGLLSGCSAEVGSEGSDSVGVVGSELVVSQASLAAPAQLSSVSLSRLPQKNPCQAFDSYTAALARDTIACIGTIGPNTFRLNDKGHLRRSFQACTVPLERDPDAPKGDGEDHRLQNIDDMISIQSRNERAGVCIPRQWTTWRQGFLAAGNRVCPSLEFVQNIGSPNPEGVKANASRLPHLNPKEGLPAGREGTVIPGDQLAYYKASFREGTKGQPCGDAQSCAQACLGGLPGGFVGNVDGYTVVDPLWWLMDYKFPDPSEDPFMGYDYYHPMSFENELPGDLYGHINRVGEQCSYYLAPDHYLAVLQADCIVDYDLSSCMSRCTLY